MNALETLLTGLIRLPLVGQPVGRLLRGMHRTMAGAMKRVARDTVRPRNWSNCELRKFAPMYDGEIINVSGWRDEDKEGGYYKDYFSSASGYAVSNYVGEKGSTGAVGEIFLDLEGELPAGLGARFQVAFNHTVLEHVFDIRRAIANICALSRDTVILVTPFLQQVHFEDGSFGDYWRPTPMCIARMLAENGFEVVYQSCNDNEWYIVYVFTVAVRNPQRHRGLVPPGAPATNAGVIHFGLDGGAD